jgi:hypothetical protein
MRLNEIPGLEGQGYIFTRNGMVQHYRNGGKKGMLVAATHESAKKLADMFKREGHRMSIAAVGTIPGETLEVQARSAIRDAGADGIFFTHDGESLRFLTPA